MESQKIMNLLNHKWYVIYDRNNGQYDEGNDEGIKIDTEVVKPFYVIMLMLTV